MSPCRFVWNRMPRPRGPLLGCAFALLAFGCSEPASPPGRVLLVGIDGATLRIAEPMLRAGRLPHLAALASAGVYGPLRAHMPLTSPRIWTSIATGKNPRKHGILGFAREGEGGERRLYESSDRVGHALWNIASDAGLRVAVVNWWTTYPLETVNGVMVSDHLLAREIQGRLNLTGARPDPSGPIVYPETWEERVQELAKADEPLTGVADPFADAAVFPDWVPVDRLRQRYRDDEWVTRIALAVEAEIHPDLMLVFLPGIDRVSHRLWGATEPDAEPSPFTREERAASLEALKRYYEFTDALIGRLLARYGGSDLALVVSDHGFEGGSSMIFLTGEHKSVQARNGVIFARGPGVAPPSQKQQLTVNDVTPTVLAWLGLPVGEDMDGVPARFLGERADAVARIPTHDTAPVERIAIGPSGGEDALLEQLRSLGYLEQDDSH